MDFERVGIVREDLVRVWAVRVVRRAWVEPVELVRGCFVWDQRGSHVMVQWPPSLSQSRWHLVSPQRTG